MNTERLLTYVQALMIDCDPGPIRDRLPSWQRLERIETYLIKRMHRGTL